MTSKRLPSPTRILRSPATIVGELVALALLGILGAALPQAGVASPAEVARLRTHGSFLTALVDALALDHVFRSPWFLAVLALTVASLGIVVVEQVRRLRAQWRLLPAETAFRNAPLRAEFLRPAREGAQTTLRVQGKWALVGSPLFHTGLLCVILAGVLQALFSVSAVVDLFEGEVLPATVEAWGAQWPGPLGKPFHLDEPLRLVSVEKTQYDSGDLMNLRLKLIPAGAEGGPAEVIGINEELPLERGRLYVGAQHGPAALVEWAPPDGSPVRTAALLEQKEPAAYGAYTSGPDGLVARIRVPLPPGGARPDHAEVRILRGHAALVEGPLRPGETLATPNGTTLRLHSLPYWARLHANHDPALPLAYLGFALALLGAALALGPVRVDEWVCVTPEGDQERVVVAMRPHRFVPLFRERFDRLVREHGGEA